MKTKFQGDNLNKRQRKKYKKKNGTWVNPREVWNLDHTIANFMIPRLKEFKKHTIGYPGIQPYDTYEKWMEALDKMIRAFEIVRDWDDIGCRLYNEYGVKGSIEAIKPYKEEMDEGLEIFAHHIQSLWW